MAGSSTITVSVVSHGQNGLVNQFLADFERHCRGIAALVLTQNAPDATPFATSNVSSPHEIIVNRRRKGFGANHNAAFTRCHTPFFCVVNPDIRLSSNPFPPLLQTLEDDRAGVVGPLVRNPAGVVDDSARRFPTAAILLRKLIVDPSEVDYPVDRGPVDVDWIAGMFMLFRSDTYRAISGFDEAYFLYYEDVDLCRRLHAAGNSVIYNPAAEVVHNACRASRRNPRFAFHHLASALRYFSRS